MFCLTFCKTCFVGISFIPIYSSLFTHIYMNYKQHSVTYKVTDKIFMHKIYIQNLLYNYKKKMH